MKYARILLIFLVLLLPSCKSKQTPSKDPYTIYTSAAQTVSVKLTENAKNNPYSTSIYADTLSVPGSTQPVMSDNTPTTAPQTAATATFPTTEDKAEYLDTEPGDGTQFITGESFNVTWTMENTGPTTWNTNYQLRFFSGDRMGSGLPSSYSFPEKTETGETVALTANFIAPSKAGTYKSIWVLTNQEGVNFYPVYIEVDIVVPSATPTMTSTESVSSSETPTLTNTP